MRFNIFKILSFFILLLASFLFGNSSLASIDVQNMTLTDNYVTIPYHDANTVLICSAVGDMGSRFSLNTMNLGIYSMTMMQYQFGTYQRAFYLKNPPTGAYLLTANVNILSNSAFGGAPSTICTMVYNVDPVTPIKAMFLPPITGTYGGYYPNGTLGNKLLALFVTGNNNATPITSSNSTMLATVKFAQNTYHTFFTSYTTINSALQLVSYGNLSVSGGMAFVEFNNSIPGFAITSPTGDEAKIRDSEITVSGTCPINGTARIGVSNSCIKPENIQYTADCVNHEWTAPLYFQGENNFISAWDISSLSGDCVDYDELMDTVEVDGFAVVEGYPSDWHFNYEYYDDFDIKIKSPAFDMPALTLPRGSTNVDFTFSFVYPQPLSPNIVFKILQYDSDGNLLNGAYHEKFLYQMTDPSNYTVNLLASTTSLNYVVQMIDNGNMKRQYPFAIFTSDLNLIINPDTGYLFPRLVESLKKKVVFNYYFAFYDGFYALFTTSPSVVDDKALDITFKSMSANKVYALEIPIFKGSDPSVKTFASGLRPYVNTFLWLIFALYVVIRINHLFNSDD